MDRSDYSLPRGSGFKSSFEQWKRASPAGFKGVSDERPDLKGKSKERGRRPADPEVYLELFAFTNTKSGICTFEIKLFLPKFGEILLYLYNNCLGVPLFQIFVVSTNSLTPSSFSCTSYRICDPSLPAVSATIGSSI